MGICISTPFSEHSSTNCDVSSSLAWHINSNLFTNYVLRHKKGGLDSSSTLQIRFSTKGGMKYL